ncbi:hypothetical protein MBLNU230_g4756t1 [Neophaeotheca triangularis]
MAQPVIVRAYTGPKTTPSRGPTNPTRNRKDQQPTFPVTSSYAFADILKCADSPELQTALDGIAEIAANNRTALADEYSSHLPPLGEITASSATVPARPGVLRPRVLTTVEEASSSGSEGSGRRWSGASFCEGQEVDILVVRRVRIGCLGRAVVVCGTTATARPGGVEAVKSTEAESMRFTHAQRDTVLSPARTSLQRNLIET